MTLIWCRHARIIPRSASRPTPPFVALWRCARRIASIRWRNSPRRWPPRQRLLTGGQGAHLASILDPRHPRRPLYPIGEGHPRRAHRRDRHVPYRRNHPVRRLAEHQLPLGLRGRRVGQWSAHARHLSRRPAHLHRRPRATRHSRVRSRQVMRTRRPSRCPARLSAWSCRYRSRPRSSPPRRGRARSAMSC